MENKSPLFVKASEELRQADDTKGSLRGRNIKIHNRRTSIRLEPEMWEALYEIADIESCSIHDLCTAVHDCKKDNTRFTAAVRVFLMAYYRSAAFMDNQVQRIRNNVRMQNMAQVS